MNCAMRSGPTAHGRQPCMQPCLQHYCHVAALVPALQPHVVTCNPQRSPIQGAFILTCARPQQHYCCGSASSMWAYVARADLQLQHIAASTLQAQVLQKSHVLQLQAQVLQKSTRLQTTQNGVSNEAHEITGRPKSHLPQLHVHQLPCINWRGTERKRHLTTLLY